MVEPSKESDRDDDPLTQRVADRTRRKVRGRRERRYTVWFGLGMFGLVGWSVVIPTVAGVVLGAWIDRTWQSSTSWTLTCMLIGAAGGCALAWYWLRKEGDL
ncbi:MAG: AtpZ/AtpI family protein [Myxococcota bacterium]